MSPTISSGNGAPWSPLANPRGNPRGNGNGTPPKKKGLDMASSTVDLLKIQKSVVCVKLMGDIIYFLRQTDDYFEWSVTCQMCKDPKTSQGSTTI